jgi:hypothetical protein
MAKKIAREQQSVPASHPVRDALPVRHAMSRLGGAIHLKQLSTLC